MRPAIMQTMAWAYQQICAGEDPWTALGNFSNAWYRWLCQGHEICPGE